MLMLLTLCENTAVQVIVMIIKTYSELITLGSFKERYLYLKLSGIVGDDTFAGKRYLNQVLYTSKEWRLFRDVIIRRDLGRDLACEGYDIFGRVIIHHINPITIEDAVSREPKIFDPDNVVCVSHNTHQAIHYGDASLLLAEPILRTANDTCPWKKIGL